MSKRAGTVVTMRGPRRRRRRRRRPVRARALVGGRAASTSTSTCSTQRDEREPRLLRAVRARAPVGHRPQRRRRPASGARTRSSPRCSTTPRTPSCSRPSREFPRVVAQAAELREPHRVARYLEELAGLFHKWYEATRVTPRGEEPVTDGHRTRLWVARRRVRCSPTASDCSA